MTPRHSQMDKIAFFDFDGTITDKDSLLEFIKFSKGNTKYLLGFALNSPWILAYKLKIISNQRAKEAVLRYFFGKMPLPVFEDYCSRFASERVPGLVRRKALKEIRMLREIGFRIVIVSASPGNWILPWAGTVGADLIATRLETRPSRSPGKNTVECLTGKISGKNCHGEEKVKRIREQFRLEDFYPIHAYGDSHGDIPMLELGSYSFMKPFR
jgi:phosphatidylglycerophosphatase C